MPPELRAAIAEVRERFIASLMAMVLDLEHQCTLLEDPAQSRAALETAGRMVHKVAGIAKNVGFPELGLQAANLDGRIQRVLRMPLDNELDRSLQPRLEALMDMMEQALDA
mgnify:CR=1 FL=1